MKKYIFHICQAGLCVIFGAAFLFFCLRQVLAQDSVSDIPLLNPGAVIENSLDSQEIHHYKFDLEKDTFLQVRLKQNGIDIRIIFANPDGRYIASMDSTNGVQGSETLSFIAESPGIIVLEIKPIDAKAKAGSYLLTSSISQATPQDRRRVEVERIFMDGMVKSVKNGPSDSTFVQFETALKGWQELQDSYMVEVTNNQIRRLKNRKALLLYKTASNLVNKGGDESLKTAILFLKEASKITKETGEKQGEINCLSMLATIKYDTGNKKEALNYYGQVLPLVRELKDQESEASILNNLGSISFQLEENRQALDYFEQALVLFRILKNRKAEAAKLNDIGAVHIALDEAQKAVDILNQALLIHQERKDKEGEAIVLTNLGKAYSALEKPEEALKVYLQAGAIYPTINSKEGEASNFRGLGSAYSDLEEHQKSIEAYEKALPFYLASPTKGDAADILDWIAVAYSAMGNKPETIAYFRQSRALYKEIGDVESEVRTLSSLGALSLDVGEKQDALDYYLEALSLCQRAKEKQCEAIAFSDLGNTYIALGERQKAVTEYDKALKILIEVRDKKGECGVRALLGAFYNSIGNDIKASEYLNQALVLARDIKDKKREIETLNGLASLVNIKVGADKKLEYYQRILSLDENNVAALNNIALVYDELGEKQRAANNRIQAFLHSQGSNKDMEIVGLLALEARYKSLGNKNLAIFFGKKVVDRYQELRQVIGKSDYETQRAFLRQIDFVYKDVAQNLIEERRFAEAIQVMDFYRDQQFYDLGRNLNEPAKHCFVSPPEAALNSPYNQAIEKVQTTGGQIEDLERRTGRRELDEYEAAQLQKLRGDLKLAGDKFIEFLKEAENEFSKTNNEYQNPSSPALGGIQPSLRELKAKTKQSPAALYTFIGREKLYILLVQPEGEIKSFETPIKEADLEAKIRQFYAILYRPFYDPKPLAKELYDIVFKPVEATLKADRVTTLLWSLEGDLRYIPVTAFWDGEKYLVERYQNVIFTRIDSDRTLRSVAANWKGIGFGSSLASKITVNGEEKSFPALPFTNQELSAIFGYPGKSVGIIKGEVFADDKFDKKSFLNLKQNNFHLVHISSHFSFRPGDDLRSFLVLGNGSFITLNEMKKTPDLFSEVELLTLSACDTATTQADSNGREIDAFAELAQRLGAGSVIATLWQVREDSTSYLMKAFYENREKGKQLKVQALQKAQLDLLYGRNETGPGARSPQDIPVVKGDVPPTEIEIEQKYRVIFMPEKGKQFSHPYYWAPFVLFGNWQ
jgi:CHAT domain-containing protein/Flp pilus assembly protein TadD